MLKTGIRRSVLCIAAFLAGTLSFERQADAAFLSTLISTNGTIQQGDKLFQNFTYSRSPTTNNMPLSSAIEVNGITLSGKNGLNFVGNFRDANPALTGSTAIITYQVSVVNNPGFYIFRATMDGTPAAPVDPGFGTIAVTQSFAQNGSTNQIAATTGLPATTSSTTTFGQELFLNVTTVVSATQVSGTPATNIQSFSQTYGQSVPEPGSGMIMITGLGIVGLTWIRRRRSVVNA